MGGEAILTELLVPFGYNYMLKAMWVSALVGGVCAFLSAYLMLKGWSLMGDALSHSIVPGVAGAYMLGLPFSIGAFLAGGLAALTMLFVNERTGLKQDAVIGLIFTSFFGLGLFMISLPSPLVFEMGLATIIVGNGLFKPNISTMVGKLYSTEDGRRDSGFTIFYMGINLGALIAPVLTGLLAGLLTRLLTGLLAWLLSRLLPRLLARLLTLLGGLLHRLRHLLRRLRHLLRLLLRVGHRLRLLHRLLHLLELLLRLLVAGLRLLLELLHRLLRLLL
jgi:MFS family permease